ncbi:MAG: hypothetical protein K5705_01580 [Oscillospiraceae bacterium]|nr:hypothetical protein [Oscillospiraceae bacterium]MCR4758958.1 hypothetical protein [Oscillospiraceae bacterium]
MMYQNQFKTVENRTVIRPLAVAAAGFLTGLLMILSTQVCQEYSVFNLLYTFGQMSSGLLLWAVICTVIALKAGNPGYAARDVLCFLVPMIAITGLAGYITNCFGWFGETLLACRIAALLPAAGAAAIIWTVRRSQTMAWLSIPFASLMFWFDSIAILDGEPLPMLAEFLLLAGFAWMVLHTSRAHVSQCQAAQFAK